MVIIYSAIIYVIVQPNSGVATIVDNLFEGAVNFVKAAISGSA